MQFTAKVIFHKANEKKFLASETEPEHMKIVSYTTRLYGEFDGHGIAIDMSTPTNDAEFETGQLRTVTIGEALA